MTLAAEKRSGKEKMSENETNKRHPRDSESDKRKNREMAQGDDVGYVCDGGARVMMCVMAAREMALCDGAG